MIAREHPYREWLNQHLIELATVKDAPEIPVPDHQTVLRRPVTQCRVGVAGIGERTVVGTDRLEVPTTPAVRHLPCRGLHGEAGVIRSAALRPTTHDFDLGDAEPMRIEQIVEPASGETLRLQPLILADVQTDAGEAGRGRRRNPILHRVEPIEAEVVEHQIGDIQVPGHSSFAHRRIFTRAPQLPHLAPRCAA